MALSKDTVLAYVNRPEFQDVIDLLIDQGLLAGRWTFNDLVEALDLLAVRREVVDLFADVDNDVAVEEAMFQRHLVTQAAKTRTMQAWRAKPENVARERQQDQQLRSRRRETRALQYAAERLAYMQAQRRAAKAARQARLLNIPPPPPPQVPAGALKWKRQAKTTGRQGKQTAMKMGKTCHPA